MPKQLIAGYHRFRKGYFLQHKKELTMLAKGQSPNIAVIGCCDSRVDPAIIFDAHPGDLFVIRNVANLVPAYNNSGQAKGTSSALEFAITGLEVSHIVVLGHAQCGGIASLMNRKTKNNTSSFLDQWMDIAEPVKQNILSQKPQPEDKYAECEKATIVQSLNNLLTFPWIKKAVQEGTLELHGWYYDLNKGTILCFDKDSQTFKKA